MRTSFAASESFPLPFPFAPCAICASSAASACTTHSAKLCMLGGTPLATLLNVVKPTKPIAAAVVGAVLLRETSVCDSRSVT